MEKYFQKISTIISVLLIVLFPFFFLNITQEFFVTNKLFFLTSGVLLLTVILSFKLLITKKLSWESKLLDLPIFLFIISASLSIFVSSPNKFTAILNPNFGLLIFLTLGLLYLFISRQKESINKIKLFQIVTSVLSVITLIVFFQPFKNLNLPSNFQFINNPIFTTLGNQIDLAIFLGFGLILNVYAIFSKDTNTDYKNNIIANYLFLVINLLAIFLTGYRIFTNNIVLPPFSNSWFAVLEVMKNVKTAFFGIGIDNFSTVFTKVKDLSYNQSKLWQISSFNLASNLPLHILVETGIIGFFSYIFLMLTAFKSIINSKNSLNLLLIIFITVVSLIIPPSLVMLFLFFLVFALISKEETNISKPKQIDLNEFPLLYIGLSLILLIFTGFSFYYLSRSYTAEVYFKMAINGIAKNNGKEVYDNLKKARQFNPYEEKYVLNFSQTNLLIANNLASKKEISDQDRQVITQAIQTAILEAKTLITLNPNKSQYYENLADIYRNIISLAKGSDAWTISAYQRAIVLDPINPLYRINLGGIYYLLGQYSDAVLLFEQAVSLKPDWPNAYYNLAWGYYQNKEYDKATASMQNVVKLIDKKTSPKDWEKANKELEEFKNKLSTIQEKSSSSNQLNLPEKPVNELDPKLELPKEASPEGKI